MLEIVGEEPQIFQHPFRKQSLDTNCTGALFKQLICRYMVFLFRNNPFILDRNLTLARFINAIPCFLFQ